MKRQSDEDRHLAAKNVRVFFLAVHQAAKIQDRLEDMRCVGQWVASCGVHGCRLDHVATCPPRSE